MSVILFGSSRLLHSFAHNRYDVFGVRPGSAQELGEQSTLSGNNWSTVDEDVELPPPTLFEFDGSPQSIMDEGSETRCLCGSRTSGLAVDDSDVHGEEYSSANRHRPGHCSTTLREYGSRRAIQDECAEREGVERI